MDETPQDSAQPTAEERPTPPPEVEVLLIALAAAEADRTTLAAQLEEERTGRLATGEALLAAEGLAAGQQDQQRQDAERYRAAVLLTVPDVPPELVTGESIDAVEQSLAAARATVATVRRHLAEHVGSQRVPAGSPTRGATDIGALSPRQKIALALVRPSSQTA